MTFIIVLLIIGIFLLLAEILVIPGVGIAGVLGLIILAISIWQAYAMSLTTGHIFLAVSILSSIASLTLALRGNTWQRLALKSEINSKVNPEIEENIKAGDFGKTVSRLMPSGKASINNMYVEVHSIGQFIPQGTEIEVIKVDHYKIIVKPKEL